MKKKIKKKIYKNTFLKHKFIINKSLIQNILQTDFLIINSSKNICFNKHYISISKTLITLKIFIRLLFFLKKEKKNNQIYFWMNNLFNVELVNQFFLSYTIKKRIIVDEKYPFFIYYNTISKLMIRFENENSYLKNLFRILKNRNYLLNQNISLYKTPKQINSYNIYNDTLCIKKVILLLLFILKIFK